VQFGTVSFFGQAHTLVCINARKAADAEGVRMSRFRLTWIGVLFLMLFSSVAGAQSFSRYRDFEFGMDIATVAQMVHMDASAATTVHRRDDSDLELATILSFTIVEVGLVANPPFRLP
jgi:hypothetical protein